MNIVIVGGGTAGWLAALFISKIQGNTHKVTLVESSDIGIVGAGEGSTVRLNDIINNRLFDFGCNEQDFLIETGATLKYGIKHVGWTNNKDDYYYGPIGASMTYQQDIDTTFMHAVANYPLNQIHRSAADGFLIEYNKSSYGHDLKPIIPNAHSYHFDAHLVGKYFKKICVQSGVTAIDGKISNVNLHENGFIKSVTLENGTDVEGDIFIDCSGFARLLNKKVGGKWVSYKDNLPVNCALPFLKKYADDEVIQPVTHAIAQNNGWMWKIPTASRYGCGYVFCDDFITPEKAQEELELNLGHEIDPIRVLKFDTGRLDKCWEKNCISFGLSSAFAEPLEATSIHSTIVMLYWFTFDFLKENMQDTCNSGNTELFNERCSTMFDSFRDFLVLHYQGGRTDSEFWKYISSGATLTPRVRHIIESSKTRAVNSRDFENFWGSAGNGLWSYVLAGTRNYSPETAAKNLQFYNINNVGAQIDAFNNQLETNFGNLLLDHTKFVRIIAKEHEKIKSML